VDIINRLSKVVKCGNKRAVERIESLPKIYQVGCWFHYGVREFPFSGKYTVGGEEPLVWYWRDSNGTADEYVLLPISHTTTGSTICWSFSEKTAKKIAEALEQHRGRSNHFV